LENIKARAHFLVLLTPTTLERCSDPEDYIRREIEAAMDTQRNIVGASWSPIWHTRETPMPPGLSRTNN
jgi:hypothetical protein